MPHTITAFIPMTFVCKHHQSCELEVFQPANSVTYVGKCIKCQQENDRVLNGLNFERNDHIALIQSLQERLKNFEQPTKPKRGSSLYLNGRKINFVTKKKGGKK